MKKIISLLLAAFMVLTLGIAVSAEPVDETSTEEPLSYLWLSNTSDNEKDTVLTYRIDASEFKGKTQLRIFGVVKFEDIQSANDGTAFANIYFYNSSDEIIAFEDWADSRLDPTPGEWHTWEHEFEVSKLDDFAYATVGFGFWNATGKAYFGPVNMSANKEMFWTRGFIGPLDYDDETIDASATNNIDADHEGLTFETVFPEKEDVGTNLCLNEGVDITIIGGPKEGHTDDDGVFYPGSIYKGSLNDGICGVPDMVPEWFGFHLSSNAASGSIDDTKGTLGTMLVDLGAEEDINRVRLYFWSPAALGIGKIAGCRAYYSNDKENWTEFGDLLYDSEEKAGWADSDVKDTVTARYVKVEYLFTDGSWGMVSELEVISAKQISVDDPTSQPAESSDPVESSTPTTSTDTPSTSEGPSVPASDSGIVALAVIAAIAVAGAVVVKKVR